MSHNFYMFLPTRTGSRMSLEAWHWRFIGLLLDEVVRHFEVLERSIVSDSCFVASGTWCGLGDLAAKLHRAEAVVRWHHAMMCGQA